MPTATKLTPILQAVVELHKGERAGTTKVWFEPQDTPYFYWSIPQSPTDAALGFIAEDAILYQARAGFLRRKDWKAVELQSARISAYQHLSGRGGALPAAAWSISSATPPRKSK